MNKSVFRFLRQPTMWHCSQLLWSTDCAAIDQYLLPAGCTTANPPHAAAAVNRWDRWMDTILLHRPSLSHNMWPVSIIDFVWKSEEYGYTVSWHHNTNLTLNRTHLEKCSWYNSNIMWIQLQWRKHLSKAANSLYIACQQLYLNH